MFPVLGYKLQGTGMKDASLHPAIPLPGTEELRNVLGPLVCGLALSLTFIHPLSPAQVDSGKGVINPQYSSILQPSLAGP